MKRLQSGEEQIRISGLIHKLAELEAKHGDVLVYAFNNVEDHGPVLGLYFVEDDRYEMDWGGGDKEILGDPAHINITGGGR